MVKVEEGLCDGKVLYHSFVKKSSGEASHQQSEKEKERELKEKRRKQQVCSSALHSLDLSNLVSQTKYASQFCHSWVL